MNVINHPTNTALKWQELSKINDEFTYLVSLLRCITEIGRDVQGDPIAVVDLTEDIARRLTALSERMDSAMENPT